MLFLTIAGSWHFLFLWMFCFGNKGNQVVHKVSSVDRLVKEELYIPFVHCCGFLGSKFAVDDWFDLPLLHLICIRIASVVRLLNLSKLEVEYLLELLLACLILVLGLPH